MTVTMLRAGVAGAGGRMGRAVLELLEGRDDMQAVPLAREDIGSPQALRGCDVVVDFTSAAGSVALAEAAGAGGGPALVIGSTGLDDSQEAAVGQAATLIPIVKAGNFSLGVNLLIGLVEQGVRALGPDYDVEVFEAHHRLKADAPSGTALMLGRAAAKARGVGLEAVAVHGRQGNTGPRLPGAIGFSILRAGGIVGEHAVVLAAEDEIVTLSHSARDRRLFARGALVAARWVVGRPAGLYDMRDVLGLTPSA